MEKQTVSLRLDATLNAYLRALAEEKGSTFTHTLAGVIQVGLENRKDVNPLLEERRQTALDSMRFEEADAAISVEMKKGYLVENFRKLIHKIRHSRDMSEERRVAVVAKMFRRIEVVLGKESSEYKECERIAHLRGRREDDTKN